MPSPAQFGPPGTQTSGENKNLPLTDPEQWRGAEPRILPSGALWPGRGPSAAATVISTVCQKGFCFALSFPGGTRGLVVPLTSWHSQMSFHRLPVPTVPREVCCRSCLSSARPPPFFIPFSLQCWFRERWLYRSLLFSSHLPFLELFGLMGSELMSHLEIFQPIFPLIVFLRIVTARTSLGHLKFPTSHRGCPCTVGFCSVSLPLSVVCMVSIAACKSVASPPGMARHQSLMCFTSSPVPFVHPWRPDSFPYHLRL